MCQFQISYQLPSPWVQENIEALNISYRLISFATYLMDPFYMNPELSKPGSEGISQALDDEFTEMVHSKFNGSVVDFLDAVTVSCEDFVMMCKLGLGSEMPGEQCCRQVFAKKGIYSPSGKCFTTQGVMRHRVIFPSKPNGLSVLVHAPKDIADKMDPDVANWMSMAKKGIEFAVTDAFNHPVVSLIKGGMGTRLGTMTEVPITKQAIDFTDTIRGLFITLHDRSSCIRDHRSNLEEVPGCSYFTQENCKLAKLQVPANANMGCNLIGLPPRSPSLPHCGPMKTAMLFREIGRFTRAAEEGRDIISQARAEATTQKEAAFEFGEMPYNAQCPNDCFQNIYRISVSSYDITPTVIKYIREEARLIEALRYSRSEGRALNVSSISDDEDGFALLTFYLPTFDFIKIVQHRRGPLEWLADVGGSLGLYLGASVFTIAEILWLEYLLVAKCLCRIFNKRGGSRKRRLKQKVGKAESESKEQRRRNEREEEKAAQNEEGERIGF